jgi:hypothetical protein
MLAAVAHGSFSQQEGSSSYKYFREADMARDEEY